MLKQIFIQGGSLFVLAFVVIGLMAQCSSAHAEPGNAKNVYGNFIMVVGGTMSQGIDTWCPALGGDCHQEDSKKLNRIYPFTIQGFKSQFACQGVALEMMNYYNTRGYKLDARCWGISK